LYRVVIIAKLSLFVRKKPTKIGVNDEDRIVPRNVGALAII
jgi:hypothetical protein